MARYDVVSIHITSTVFTSHTLSMFQCATDLFKQIINSMQKKTKAEKNSKVEPMTIYLSLVKINDKCSETVKTLSR